MPTVLRQSGLRILIYSGDHGPPHVHVFGDGETKIELGTYHSRPIQIKTTASKAEARRALRLVESEHRHLLDCWIEIHGQF